jgi:hypothetical protein
MNTSALQNVTYLDGLKFKYQTQITTHVKYNGL